MAQLLVGVERCLVVPTLALHGRGLGFDLTHDLIQVELYSPTLALFFCQFRLRKVGEREKEKGGAKRVRESTSERARKHPKAR